VSSAFRLSDGRIVAAPWATAELRVYDSTGCWLRDIGRRGSGPGEFEGLGWVHLAPGDTLVTYEPMNRRISVFDSAGRFQRLVSIQAPPAAEYPRLVAAAGGWLLASARRFQPIPAGFGLMGIRRSLYRYSMSGELVDSLLELPPHETISVGGGGTWSRPFEPRSLVDALGDRFFVASTERFEIRAHRLDGTLERVIRRPEPTRPLAGGEYAAAVAASVAEVSDPAARARRAAIYASAPAVTVRPAFAHFTPSAGGGLWVQHFDTPQRFSRQASIFDREGDWLGDVTLPEGLLPLQVGRDFVLGTWQDADGATHVRVHRLSWIGGRERRAEMERVPPRMAADRRAWSEGEPGR
jgi:hypothetical protein